MKALITASFDPAARSRLARHMEVVHEDWKERQAIYFDGAQFAKRIAEVGADVLVVEADLVHAEVLDACPLKMIGVCRGAPSTWTSTSPPRRASRCSTPPGATPTPSPT